MREKKRRRRAGTWNKMRQREHEKRGKFERKRDKEPTQEERWKR